MNINKIIETSEVMNIAWMCLDISQYTKHDVFFDYSPIKNTFSVKIYRGGYHTDRSPEVFYDVFFNTYKEDSEKIARIVKTLKSLYGDEQ